jgi:hypothetical protein
VQEVPGSNPGGPTSSFIRNNLPTSIIVEIAPEPLVRFANVPSADDSSGVLCRKVCRKALAGAVRFWPEVY